TVRLHLSSDHTEKGLINVTITREATGLFREIRRSIFIQIIISLGFRLPKSVNVRFALTPAFPCGILSDVSWLDQRLWPRSLDDIWCQRGVAAGVSQDREEAHGLQPFSRTRTFRLNAPTIGRRVQTACPTSSPLGWPSLVTRIASGLPASAAQVE